MARDFPLFDGLRRDGPAQPRIRNRRLSPDGLALTDEEQPHAERIAVLGSPWTAAVDAMRDPLTGEIECGAPTADEARAQPRRRQLGADRNG